VNGTDPFHSAESARPFGRRDLCTTPAVVHNLWTTI
jgi:hypothetical protein